MKKIMDVMAAPCMKEADQLLLGQLDVEQQQALLEQSMKDLKTDYDKVSTSWSLASGAEQFEAIDDQIKAFDVRSEGFETLYTQLMEITAKAKKSLKKKISNDRYDVQKFASKLRESGCSTEVATLVGGILKSLSDGEAQESPIICSDGFTGNRDCSSVPVYGLAVFTQIPSIAVKGFAGFAQASQARIMDKQKDMIASMSKDKKSAVTKFTIGPCGVVLRELVGF